MSQVVSAPRTISVDSAALSRRLQELALISEAPAPVVTRVLFSEADLRGRDYVRRSAREAGLTIREDAVGNIFARWEGSEPTLPAVGTGSHTDAIPNAGLYDGVVGVLGGFEALHALKRAGFKPRRSIEVVMFTAEEPTRFGRGCLGSRLMAGALPLETRLVIPQVGPSAALDAPASSQEQKTTPGTTFGNVMTWALSQGLVWQWQDDAGGWVNMHESWMPQLTTLKKGAGGNIWLRHDWKQRNGSTRLTWYNVDVNAMMQTSHDNGKTRRVRALAQILPWAGDATASSQAQRDFTEHTAGGWPCDASGASCSGHPPETSSQSQRMPMPSPPPSPPPPAPCRDASQQTENVMEASQQPAPANTGLSALQPARQIADDEESVVLV
jgi:hypothetical protein